MQNNGNWWSINLLDSNGVHENRRNRPQDMVAGRVMIARAYEHITISRPKLSPFPGSPPANASVYKLHVPRASRMVLARAALCRLRSCIYRYAQWEENRTETPLKHDKVCAADLHLHCHCFCRYYFIKVASWLPTELFSYGFTVICIAISADPFMTLRSRRNKCITCPWFHWAEHPQEKSCIGL